MPKHVQGRIEQIIKRFLWEKDHDSRVSLPKDKDKGGLGIKDLQIKRIMVYLNKRLSVSLVSSCAC